MNVRPAQAEDLERILEIYTIARRFQCDTGNPTQWAGGYPARELIEEDIRTGASHVCEENGRVVGVFALFTGEDPTYGYIEGAWPNDMPYATIHRIASDGSCRGVASFCFNWCLERHDNLRIDTHADNRVMQHVLEKNGFVPCGTIYLENGDPRLAYQKTAKREAASAEPQFAVKVTHGKEACREFGGIQVKKTKSSFVMLICSIVLFFLQLVISFMDGMELLSPLALGSVTFIYWLFLDRIIGNGAYRGLTKAVLSTETTYVFQDRYIATSSSLEASNLSYRTIDSIAESDNLFALYVNRNMAHLLPKACFTQGTPEEFRQFIAEKTQKPVTYYKTAGKPALKWVLAVLVPLLMIAASFGAAKLGEVLSDGIVLPYIHGNYTITLPVAFEESPEYAEEWDGYNYYYTEDVSVYVTCHTADELTQTLGYAPTLEEYAALLYWDESTPLVTQPDGSVVVSEVYENLAGDTLYYYDIFHLKDGVFWSTEFICAPEDQATYEEQFKEWAATIEIK